MNRREIEILQCSAGERYDSAIEALCAGSVVTLPLPEPIWFEGGERFALLEGDECHLYNPENEDRRLLFHRKDIENAVAAFGGKGDAPIPFAPGAFRFTDGDDAFQVYHEGSRYRISLGDQRVISREDLPFVERAQIQGLSPDGKYIAFIRDFNVCLRRVKGGESKAMTMDGTRTNAYLGCDDTLCYQFMGPPERQWAKQEFLWSPDSRWIAVYNLDQEKVPKVHLLDQRENPARMETLHYGYPGGDEIFRVHLSVIHVPTGSVKHLYADPEAHPILLYLDWDPDGNEIYYAGFNRGHDRMDLLAFDPVKGETRLVLTESYPTHIEDSYMQFQRLPDSGKFVWASERDGWNHLYLYEKDGTLVNRMTEGPFPVSRIVSFDRERECLYFLGAGDTGDPYYQHLFRVNISGSGLTRLTRAHATHRVYPSPSSRFFVVRRSAPDIPPRTELINREGETLRILAESDISCWLKAGWRFPEAFSIPAADGVTRLHGLIYKPRDFDPKKKYPLIEYVYPGPITHATPKIFVPDEDNRALSELGFIVMVVDGRGTSGRGKAFQDFSYGNFGRYELVDHVEAIRRLGERYDFIDLNRVGIYGRSAGGYAAARGLLRYPETYQVGVAICGHHDYRKYMWYWVEQYCGHPDAFPRCFEDQANAAYAEHLTGKLLLIHGTMDDNVLPDHTIQLADILIRKGKNVDCCIVPGQRHRFSGFFESYCRRKIWDYFTAHLRPGT